VARRSKLPYSILDVMWKREEIDACGDMRQDLLAVGRRRISSLETSGRLLECVSDGRHTDWEVWNVALPSFCLPREKPALYALEKRAAGGDG